MSKNKEILRFFPQPIFRYKIENFADLNKELSNYIYNLYEEDKDGVKRSNQGGWHSQPFDLRDKNSIQHKFLLEITKHVFDTIKDFGWRLDPSRVICSEMWAIINKKKKFQSITHSSKLLFKCSILC